ncbi:helix-turn-helix domain-containing protein [Marasmitruncus massiliensis]|uniref:helix-turn-helix domain-containing protein n=1 Tax=Marasmitruncus massiliensis TaxID=1944642 RepID=UPI000C7A55C7|nr:helix-turn-helix domain-containing protein [Marasmitruncus massiliensis]
MFNNFDDVLTVEELCEALKIGKNAAYRLLNEGKVKEFRIGRVWKISKSSLESYIRQQSG